jgi:hypothetical protein
LALASAILLDLAVLGAGGAGAEDAASIGDFASADDPPVFDDPLKAVEAFKTKLAADDFEAVARLLGLDAAKLRTEQSALDTYAGLRTGAAERVVVKTLDDRRIVEIGRDLWPLPFPITKGQDGKWAFDTYAGLEEIVNRRIGENEIEAIATARAYVDAQLDYAEEDRDGDGVIEFAQKLLSSEGKTDGLYWPVEQGDGESPAGAFVEETALEKAKAGDGYFGYRFRILSGQGDNVVGGAQSYIINGNMLSGFALVAWPVRYGETGVNTFLVSHQGIVYEADLGPNTESVAAKIMDFDPNDHWQVATD